VQREPLGLIEFAVLDAVHRGGLRFRATARQIRGLREQPAGDALLHDVLHRCERDGLLQGRRDAAGRRYELTAAGRARLRADRNFRHALIHLLARPTAFRRR
jgi:DNA-binding PadR family transcriptional regulator